MTARQVYEAILIELNKENAPNILLEDFNYLFNKGINLYVNKRYNIYDMNQQTTDDLRVLKATALLSPEKCNRYGESDLIGRMMGATYELLLPSDYLHILNCICIYKVNKTFKCYDKGSIWRAAATKLTADAYSKVLDNFWLRPTYRRPYYYIHNVNQSIFEPKLRGSIIPTDPRRPFYDNLDELSTNKDYYIGWLEDNEASIFENNNDPLALELFLGYHGSNSISGITVKFTKNSHGVRFSQDGETISANLLYVICPINEDVRVYNNPDRSSWPLTLHHINTIGNSYKVYVSSQTVAGTIYVGGIEKTGAKIELGTDFKFGGVTKNSQTSEYGALGTDHFGNSIVNIAEGKGVSTSTNITDGSGNFEQISSVERAAQIRYGNSSPVRLEIRYGTDDSLFKLEGVYIDYIKVPLTIRLTQEQLDLTEDTSQMLEFPDYVCQEIINELVHLIMENISDLRLQTHPVVSLSIANPAQALTESQAQLS